MNSIFPKIFICLFFLFIPFCCSSQKLQLNIHSGLQYRNLVISQDGQYLACSNDNFDIFLMNIRTQEQIHINEELWSPREIVFDNKVERLFSIDNNRKLIVFDIPSKSIIRDTTLPTGYGIFRINSNYNMIGVGMEKSLIIYEIDSLKQYFKFETENLRIKSLDFSNEGSLVATGWDDGTIKIWNIHTKNLIYDFRGNNTFVREIRFSPKDDEIAYLDQNLLKRYSLKEKKLFEPIRTAIPISNSIQYTQDGKYILAKTSKGISVWSTITNRERKTLEAKGVVYSISPNDNILVNSDGTGIKFWDLKEEEVLSTLNIFGKGRGYTITTPDNFFDANDIGLSYLQWVDENKVIPVDKKDNHFVPNLIPKTLSGEIEKIRTLTGKIKLTNKKKKFNRAGKDKALLIAIDQYDNWNNLNNPRKDAEAIKTELEDIYNFDVKLLPNLKRSEILATIHEYSQKAYLEDEQLFIFFSGHGVKGAFVAKDSKKLENDFNKDTYVKYYDVKNIINESECKHVLVAIDACFSGTFYEGSIDKGENSIIKRPGEGSEQEEFVKRIFKYRSKIYLTSGADEPTPDGVQHSPFTTQLLKALRSRGDDDILDFKELLSYMVKAAPKPINGMFGDSETNDSFLFFVQ